MRFEQFMIELRRSVDEFEEFYVNEKLPKERPEDDFFDVFITWHDDERETEPDVG